MPEREIIAQWIAIVSTWVLGILSAFLAWVYGYGRLSQKVRGLEGDMEEFKEIHNQDIKDILKGFTDANGNPRLLSIDEHTRQCGLTKESLSTRFDSLEKKIDGNINDRKTTDQEIFDRLRASEHIQLQIASKMGIDCEI